MTTLVSIVPLLPFVLQGALLTADEFYCHHRRHLGPWERLGHPVDTMSFVAALSWLLYAAPRTPSLRVFAVLAVISCVMVTKDEWEHQHHCTGFESFLHAWLFMLHPTLLIWAGWLWWTNHPYFTFTVGGAALLAGGFAVYQIVYWNWWRRDR